jgi:HlyD family secretion protein
MTFLSSYITIINGLKRIFKKKYILFGTACLLLISGCHHYKNKVVQGYIEGRYTYLASAIGGTLEKLPVSRGDQIKIHNLIFVLDQQPESDQLQQAQKNLAQAQQTLMDLEKGQRQTVLEQIKAQRAQAIAVMTLDRKTLIRYKKLYLKGAIDKQSVDTAQANFDRDMKKIKELNANLAEAKLGARTNQIKAQQEVVAAAKADVQQAQWALHQKTMYAPISALVFDTYYRVGEYVPAGQSIVSLLAPQNIKLIFFIPEPLLSTISLGQTVQFGCDSCKEKTAATISFISSEAEYTPPVIYSKDSRDKLVYRVEAKIAPDLAIHFHTGQPVDVYLGG